MLRSLALVLLVAGFAQHCRAQVASGVLQGEVTDPSGEAVPTATVNLSGTGGTVRATATDGQGRYRVNNLVPGAYSSASPARGLRRSRRPSPS